MRGPDIFDQDELCEGAVLPAWLVKRRIKQPDPANGKAVTSRYSVAMNRTPNLHDPRLPRYQQIRDDVAARV
ncbi:hypothetical protein QCE92_14360, partial [Staphylococcus aureus]|nr:hypothetical protein [Staphylococcus aureus]